MRFTTRLKLGPIALTVATTSLWACSSDPAASPGGGGAGGDVDSSAGAPGTGPAPTSSGSTGGAPGGGGGPAGGVGGQGTAGGQSTGGQATGGAPPADGGSGGTEPSAAGGTGGEAPAGGAGGMAGRDPADKSMSFFVTSYGIARDGMSAPGVKGQGNLGGLVGADAHCQKLAAAVGSKFTWRAYLSTSAENAADRIGQGPWYNANGSLVGMDLAALHTTNGLAGRVGDAAVFGVTEDKQAYARPQHDVITGSNEDGTVATGFTCMDWTSNSDADRAMVGHLDGMGGNRPGINGWNSEHENSGCHEEGISTPGSGLFYCFAL